MSDRVARVALVVPARDEQLLVGSCLAALLTSRDPLRRSRPAVLVDLPVVLDRRPDATAPLLAAAGGPAVASDPRQAGPARAAGARCVLARSRAAGVPDAALWLASTDADTVVPVDWLAVQVELAQSGLDAVVGTVEPGDVEDPRALLAWHCRHELGEGHPYVHGANLGVRASTYLAAGGYPPLPLHEDAVLVDAVRATTDRLVATDRTRVCSSGRRAGRCDGGFATYMDEITREAV
ncbi:glycosyltransferase [Janibacter melonis]|uniref:glycosyltransferase n=1 Tax=Janibacter melonis TaxID=262209 RepID=UPI0020951C9E|nr:glycosyl transferase family 2 [Janibacter melonis]